MRKIRVIIGILLILIGLIGGMVANVSAATTANTGVTGRVVDGKTAQGWQYGAEVAVIEVGTGVLGSANLGNDGSFTVTYGTDPLGLCSGSCATPSNFAQIYVLINFTCDLNTSNGSRTTTPTLSSTDSNCPVNDTLAGGGQPLVGIPNNISLQTIDTGSGVQNLGDIDTNRGPTAVSLQTITATSTNNWLLILLPLLSIMAGGWLLVKRPALARQRS
jgi:hypothetical protein